MVARHGWLGRGNAPAAAASLILRAGRNEACREIERESGNIAVILVRFPELNRAGMPHPRLPSAAVT